MMTALDAAESSAGMLNSPSDCKMPTSAKARPVNSISGNKMRSSSAQSAAVGASKPSASSAVIGSAKSMPRVLSAPVSSVITVINALERRNASSFPSFSRYSLNTGIKLAEMAEAKIASKKLRGMRLAVKNAFAAMPVAKVCPSSTSRTRPSTLPSSVSAIITPTVRIFFFCCSKCMALPLFT